MKICRRGSKKDHGAKCIQLDVPEAELNVTYGHVAFSKSNVEDFIGDARHDYTVYFSLEELVNTIKLVADAAVKDPKSFEKHLEPALKSLTRLQAVAAGTIGAPSA
jgi:hypothetical protein